MTEIHKRYPELTDLLRTFTHSVLVDKPKDLVHFAADYFNKLKIQKEADKIKSINKAFDNEEDDEYDGDIEILTDWESKEKMRQTTNVPRQSVVCERFDPSLVDDEAFELNRRICSKSIDQEEKITEMLRSIFLFNSLDEDQLKRVIESMFPVEVTETQVIIKENDPGDNFYVIDHGIFEASNESGSISFEYKNEGSFGELALLYNCPRVATIVAKTDGLLWAMDRTSFRQLILKSAYNKRKRLENLLKSISILNELSEYDRCNLADALKTQVFHNSTIIKQGDIGNTMYFIEEGEAAVIYTNENGDEKEERRLTTGDYFGDVALLAKIPRIASVQAIGTIKVAELDVRSYNRLMGPCVDLMRANFPKYRAQLESLLSPAQLLELFPELVNSPVANIDVPEHASN